MNFQMWVGSNNTCLRITFLLDKSCVFHFYKMEYCSHVYQRKLQRLFPHTSVNNCHPILIIPMFGRKYPTILSLLRPFYSRDTTKLSVGKLLFLLKEQFPEEGSNGRSYENAVCAMFVKYVREASSGRRVVTFKNVLEFLLVLLMNHPWVLEWVHDLR